MIKLGTSDNKVLVLLSAQEFTGLAGQTASNYPDNSNISLAPLKAKLDLVNNNMPSIDELKTKCQEVITTINKVV